MASYCTCHVARECATSVVYAVAFAVLHGKFPLNFKEYSEKMNRRRQFLALFTKRSDRLISEDMPPLS